MTNIIFAKTRHTYDSYQDFWRLVELSGFTVRYLDEIDWQQDGLTVIGTPHNGEWFGIPTAKRARLIHWNLERCLPDAPHGDSASAAHYDYVDEVWASDRAMAKHCGARYVFLGGHRAFGSVDVLHKRYDVISLMYWNNRRQSLLTQLNGLQRADNGRGMWGNERHECLMQSRLMVTAHQDDSLWSEPIRFAIAGMYALPILSEVCEDAGEWNGKFESAPFTELGAKARYLLQDDVRLARMGAVAWRLVCVERDFKSQVLEAAL